MNAIPPPSSIRSGRRASSSRLSWGGLPPGRALDLGGLGHARIWLAERGWRVTAVDFSRVGLGLARS